PGARGRGAQASHRNIVRQLGAGDLSNDDTLELALGRIVEHDHRMIQTWIDLLVRHWLDPFAVRHESGGFGGRDTALMDTHPNAGWNVNSTARCIQLRVFAPFAKSQAHRLDRFRHRHNAANLRRIYKQRIHSVACVFTMWSRLVAARSGFPPNVS